MENEDLGRLSPEQVQKLAATISEAKSLTNQQEEIIQRVLAGEDDIGKLRIAHLTKYFDSYSKNLDLVARKYSELNDNFLVLDEKLNSNYRALSSDIDKLISRLKNLSKSTNAANEASESQKTQKDDDSSAEITDVTKDILHTLRSGVVIDNKQLDAILTGIRELGGAFSAGDGGNKAISTPTAVQGSAAQGFPTEPETSSFAELQEIIRHSFSTLQERLAGLGANRYETPVSGESVSQGAGASNEKGAPVSQTVEDTTRDSMGDADAVKTREDILSFIEDLAKGGEDLRQSVFVTEQQKKREEELLKKWATEKEALNNSILDLEIARLQTEEELQKRSIEVRLTSLKRVTDAELEAQNFLNSLAAENTFAVRNSAEAGDFRAREVNAKEDLTSARELEQQRVKFIAEEELKAKLANNGKLAAAEAARIQKEAAQKFKADEGSLNKLTKLRQTAQAKEQREKEKAEKKSAAAKGEEAFKTLTGKGVSLRDRVDAFKGLATNKETGEIDAKSSIKAVGAVVANAISDLAKQLNDKIDQIGSYKGNIDTRLQGSSANERSSGSYWDQLTKDMMSVGAVTPFFKQENFANNIKTLVDKGISFDLKQRAFLMTIQEKIANTFNVADGTLLRLIRIQQEDSTAGRLGMESALNSFLNEMYETTEYLTDVAASVRGSLEEMEALMEGDAATEVEYQVQKWMGSLYSVGMSQNAVTSISNALGQIAAGQVEALTNGGAGNLLVMAANEAGIPIADMLSTGLTAENTNKLLQATVNYLAEIAESSKDNRVVQQQLAGVFGVKASDLKAATNLAVAKEGEKSSIGDIYKEYLTYNNMLDQLYTMAGSMANRTSIGEMMSNIWANGQYTLAGSMSSNPVSYLTYKMASLLESTTGGIALPFVSAFGSGVDLNTTVADLMRVAAVGTGILGSIGPMISGLSSSFSGQSMLTKLGIDRGSNLKITPRGGDGVGALEDLAGGGTKTTSGSGYVGNASGSDVKNATLQEAENSKKQQMIEAMEEAEDAPVNVINMNVLKIYELLDDVAHGRNSFSVKIEGYGLTKVNSTNSLKESQGGVAGLLSSSTGASTTGWSPTSSSSGSSSGGNAGGSGAGSSAGFGVGPSVDLGGWIMT